LLILIWSYAALKVEGDDMKFQIGDSKALSKASNQILLALRLPQLEAREIQDADAGQKLMSEQLPEIPSQKLDGEPAIFDCDESGFITSWSNQAEQVYGHEAYDMIGKHIASLYTAGDLLGGRLIHELRAVGLHGAHRGYCRQKRNNEQEFWAYTESESIKDARGEMLGFRKFVVETQVGMQSPAR
jgi:PAS domain S-box-containing protein